MEQKILTGEVAIITGSAGAIGKAIAERFLIEGASVFLVDISEDNLLKVSANLKSKYGTDKVEYLTVDLTEVSNAANVVEAAVKGFEKIDILVNCAGIYPSTPAIDITEEDWDSVLDLNLKGSFFLAKEVAKQMRDKGINGRIVNITSAASEVARPGVAHYCSSKAALKMLTQVLAIEWAQYGIRVNAVGPGLVESETLLKSLTTEQARKEYKEKLSHRPTNRATKPEESARGVLFMASDLSSNVTGQTLHIDGGYTAGRVFKSFLD